MIMDSSTQGKHQEPESVGERPTGDHCALCGGEIEEYKDRWPNRYYHKSSDLYWMSEWHDIVPIWGERNHGNRR